MNESNMFNPSNSPRIQEKKPEPVSVSTNLSLANLCVTLRLPVSSITSYWNKTGRDRGRREGEEAGKLKYSRNEDEDTRSRYQRIASDDGGRLSLGKVRVGRSLQRVRSTEESLEKLQGRGGSLRRGTEASGTVDGRK